MKGRCVQGLCGLYLVGVVVALLDPWGTLGSQAPAPAGAAQASASVRPPDLPAPRPVARVAGTTADAAPTASLPAAVAASDTAGGRAGRRDVPPRPGAAATTTVLPGAGSVATSTTPSARPPAPRTAAASPLPPVRAAASPAPPTSTWTSYTDGVFVSYQSGTTYTRSAWKQPGTVRQGSGSYGFAPATGTESFTLGGSVTRVEMRGDTYTSGRRRLTGELRVADDATDGVWVAQVFQSALVRYERTSGGRLVYHSASAFDGDPAVRLTRVLATGVTGRWVRLVVSHDATAGRITVDVDGVRVLDHPSGDSGSFHLKYGVTGPASTTARGVQWRGTSLARS